MHHYFAPLEGITTYIYRNSHFEFYGKNGRIGKYFTPFLSPNQNRNFSPKERKDIIPENNTADNVVPQILTNKAEHFIRTAKELREYGYGEINLNLGCPSGTVAAKGKGAGFLAKQEELDNFLEEVFTGLTGEISVKTRIGKDYPEEFYKLIEIFNKYPISELIIHPRVQQDFYKNNPNRKVFKDALKLSKNSVCYNGDIFTVQDYKEFGREFPETDNFHAIMLGRGFLGNPGLAGEIFGEAVTDTRRLREFHDRIYSGYKETIAGDVNVLFKMKELWFYMTRFFTNPDKYWKKIKKAGGLYAYEAAVAQLFAEQDIEDTNKF